MMESSIALMQMSRTALAVNELKKNNITYIVVLTDQTSLQKIPLTSLQPIAA